MSVLGEILLKGSVNQLSGGLPGVNVYTSDQEGRLKIPTKGTTTDAFGRFQLPANTLDNYITFSFVGYGKKTFPLNGFQDKQKINVELKEQSGNLEEFEVIAKREEQKPFDWKTATAITLVLLFIIGLIIYNYKTSKK